MHKLMSRSYVASFGLLIDARNLQIARTVGPYPLGPNRLLREAHQHNRAVFVEPATLDRIDPNDPSPMTSARKRNLRWRAPATPWPWRSNAKTGP
jgi:hypothetical protein